MTAPIPSLDGRVFVAIADVEGGEVGPETVFEYHEDGGEIWATYDGGTVQRGFLVGSRTGDTLQFRYCQLNTAGETSTGRCTSRASTTDDGRIRLDETWAWESKVGDGTSSVIEVP